MIGGHMELGFLGLGQMGAAIATSRLGVRRVPRCHANYRR
jgi:hypothetical protein